MSMRSSRTIFINNKFGIRQLKETLSNLLVGSCLSPDNLWLVSPWLTDFDLLDNRTGDWDALNPVWGTRIVKFSELLIYAIESGCKLNLVTNNDAINDAFEQRLLQKIDDPGALKVMKSEKLHTKGLLTPSYFLAGSMNFTYSGTHKNEEQLVLNLDADAILEAKLEFENLYGGIDYEK
ncbi:phospholipase D-like domain-containing protein DpdK [Thalassotalea crassostreae]|uniref:phospholipase D-like domain-containing protein DpdK n=1 Tax=Thalassotalea crassostreae TaxID=1763536 RepID=UPI0009ECF733|nr:phospholipase D-like domain-containing protein DpdK [Thalassotalea crassostreae]